MAFILNVTYTMKPGLRAEFLREVSEHGIQKAVLAEEGCLQYQYFEAVDEPDKLLLVELYEKNGGRHQTIRVENADIVNAEVINLSLIHI